MARRFLHLQIHDFEILSKNRIFSKIRINLKIDQELLGVLMLSVPVPFGFMDSMFKPLSEELCQQI